MQRMRVAFLVCALFALALPSFSVEVPAGLQRFVPRGSEVIALERGDLDGNGTADAILVTEREVSAEEHPRTLSILLLDSSGGWSLAGKSDRAVYAREDGGMLGDPFQGVSIGKRSFTISHYGGSSWRWSNDFTFGWSRRDRTWQLVAAESSSFHASDPSTEEKEKHVPPRDFGKIGIDEFDPLDYLGRGPK